MSALIQKFNQASKDSSIHCSRACVLMFYPCATCTSALKAARRGDKRGHTGDDCISSLIKQVKAKLLEKSLQMSRDLRCMLLSSY